MRSLKSRAKFIFRATRQHATNLARFVTLYKTVLLLQRRLNGGKERSLDTFFAGLVGGYVVFGERNPVNEQIVLYVLSRVVTSLLPREPSAVKAAAVAPAAKPLPSGSLVPPGYPYKKPIPPSSRVFEAYAALTWAAVMWLFHNKRENLQSGMVNSMQYLYLDSEVWSNIRNLIWHNTRVSCRPADLTDAGRLIDAVTVDCDDVHRCVTMSRVTASLRPQSAAQTRCRPL